MHQANPTKLSLRLAVEKRGQDSGLEHLVGAVQIVILITQCGPAKWYSLAIPYTLVNSEVVINQSTLYFAKLKTRGDRRICTRYMWNQKHRPTFILWIEEVDACRKDAIH